MKARWLGALGLGLLALPYWLPPLYAPAPPATLSGAWHNPYAGLRGPYARTALHVHAQAWGGLTAGEQPSAAVEAAYADAGFEALVRTDYQRVGPPPLAYEHGLNLVKRHQLALGATRVVWFDQPWPTLNGTQLTLRWLAQTARLVVLAHPLLGSAYSHEALRELDGYHALEVASHAGTWEAAWDIALSSGRRVWGVAGDDCHDVRDPHQFSRAWTMVAAGEPLLDALAFGHHYAVWNADSRPAAANALTALELRDGVVQLTLAGPADVIRGVRQGGVEVAHVEGAAQLSYRLADDDQYLRLEVHTGNTTLFLNPLTRAEVRAQAQVRWPASVTAWLAPLAAGAALLARRRSHQRLG